MNRSTTNEGTIREITAAKYLEPCPFCAYEFREEAKRIFSKNRYCRRNEGKKFIRRHGIE